jgi:hypothetical protein
MKCSTLFLAAGLLAAASVTAHAQAGSGLVLSVYGERPQFRMTDMNILLATQNDRIASATSQEIAPVRDGLGYGGSLSTRLPSGLECGFAYERLGGRTALADPAGSLRYDLDADASLGFLRWNSSARHPIGFGAELGVGRVSCRGNQTVAISGATGRTGNISGSGILLEQFVSMSWRAFGAGAVEAQLGYRHANAGEIEVAGAPAYVQGARLNIDYSGPIVRFGLRQAIGG